MSHRHNDPLALSEYCFSFLLSVHRVSVEDLFTKMDTNRSGAVNVQGFLEVVSPATAAEFAKSKSQVRRHMRQSFSQKRKSAGATDESADDKVHEAQLAADTGYLELPAAFEYDDDDAESGDEWYDGLIDVDAEEVCAVFVLSLSPFPGFPSPQLHSTTKDHQQQQLDDKALCPILMQFYPHFLGSLCLTGGSGDSRR